MCEKKQIDLKIQDTREEKASMKEMYHGGGLLMSKRQVVLSSLL